MKRREFIRAAGLAAGSVVTGLAVPRRGTGFHGLARSRERNILIIMTDQQSADALSCRMGDAFLKTPAMDSLAERGMSFTRAYTANPLCIPARTSLFTGRPPHVTGIQTNDNKASLAGNVETFGSIFRRAGYDTGYLGKWHLPFPVHEKSAHGFEVMGAIKNDGLDKEIPALAEQFIKQKRGKPFLLVTSFVNPHNICEWARGEGLKNGAIGEPPSLDRCPQAVVNLQPTQDEPDIMPLMRRSYQGSALFPVGAFDEKRWREYRWAYFRLIEMVDAHVGRVLQALRASGQEENTLVVFTSDHGDCQGAHGWSQKTVLYDESARVPFVIALPGAAKTGTSGQLVNTGLDLLPTLCDFAGLEAPASLHGMSVKTIAEGSSTGSRSYVVVENKMVQGVPVDGNKPEPSGRAVRSERFKYCAYDIGERRESLVDLERDPGELVNIAGKNEYQKVLVQHRQYLAEWCRTTNDPFEIPR